MTNHQSLTTEQLSALEYLANEWGSATGLMTAVGSYLNHNAPNLGFKQVHSCVSFVEYLPKNETRTTIVPRIWFENDDCIIDYNMPIKHGADALYTETTYYNVQNNAELAYGEGEGQAHTDGTIPLVSKQVITSEVLLDVALRSLFICAPNYVQCSTKFLNSEQFETATIDNENMRLNFNVSVFNYIYGANYIGRLNELCGAIDKNNQEKQQAIGEFVHWEKRALSQTFEDLCKGTIDFMDFQMTESKNTQFAITAENINDLSVQDIQNATNNINKHISVLDLMVTANIAPNRHLASKLCEWINGDETALHLEPNANKLNQTMTM